MDNASSFSLGSLQSKVRQFLERFVQTGNDALSKLLTADRLKALIDKHCPGHRNRIYSPLTTVSMFLEQVLGADHSCQDAVARGRCNAAAQNLKLLKKWWQVV